MFAKIFYWRLIRGSSTGQAGRLQTECCSSVLSRSHCLDYFSSEHKLEYNSYFIICRYALHPIKCHSYAEICWIHNCSGQTYHRVLVSPHPPQPASPVLTVADWLQYFSLYFLSVHSQQYMLYFIVGPGLRRCWSNTCKMLELELQCTQSVHWPGLA